MSLWLGVIFCIGMIVYITWQGIWRIFGVWSYIVGEIGIGVITFWIAFGAFHLGLARSIGQSIGL